MNKNILITVAAVLILGIGIWLIASGDGEPTANGSDDSADENNVGTLSISFLGEDYSFEEVSCDGRSAFPPEHQQIGYRNIDENVEFWVERYDPEESDVVEVHMSFPEGGVDETIGEVEAYEGTTTTDEVEFELGSGTSGSTHLEPSIHLNDDVERVEDGGTIEWELSC